jgi:hypothetical protein
MNACVGVSTPASRPRRTTAPFHAAAAGHDVALHRRGSVGLETVHQLHGPRHRVIGDLHPPGPGHGRHLLHRGLEHAARLGDRAEYTERGSGDAPDAPGRRDEHELLPHRHVDIRGNVHLQASAPAERVFETANPIGDPPVELSERHPRLGSGVSDVPRAGDERDHPRQPAEDRSRAQGLGEDTRRLHPVQDGDDCRLRADQRPHGLGRSGQVPALRRHDHGIHRAHLSGVVRGVGGVDEHVAGDALQTEPPLLDGPEVLTASDEHHVLFRFGQPGSQITARTPYSEHGDAHRGRRPTPRREARATGPSACGGGSPPDPTPPSGGRRSLRR